MRVHAIDDSGRRFGPISFSLDPNETRHFNSQDLERGNPSKGLSAGVGDGSGNWRLELETDLDIAPLAYVRTSDGFLTSIHEVAAAQGISMRYHVPIFNPASNTDQQSRLRLINPGSISAEIEIDGLDDKGRSPPMGTVSLTLLAGEARVLTAQQLEQGGSGFDGRFGDGEGKWQLFVSARTPAPGHEPAAQPNRKYHQPLRNHRWSQPIRVPGLWPIKCRCRPISRLRTSKLQLIGTDPDGDTLMYVLDGPSSGPGYRDAFVQPNAGRLFAELDPGDRDRVEIPYKVTDGMLFSERALVIVTIQRTPSGGLGNLAQDLGEYGILDIDYFDLSDIPRCRRLVRELPYAPGNQGRQGSCVGMGNGLCAQVLPGTCRGRVGVFGPYDVQPCMDLQPGQGPRTMWRH